MPNGMLDENFTSKDLMETQVNVGDVFSVGSSKVIVTQPRMPCYRLEFRSGRMILSKSF
jgi:MOSC domain-containing protein YiiM